MSLSNPIVSWKRRTKNGRAMAGGWVSAQHTPTQRGEYEVRGYARDYLTWAYGHWWYMEAATNNIPYWHLAEGHYTWRGHRVCDNTLIHGNDLLLKAVELGNEEAKAELCGMGWRGDYRPYARCTCWRSGYEGHPCPVHSQ